MSKEPRLYGTWNSPFTIQTITSSSRLNDVQWDSDGETLVWLASRGGQSSLYAQTGIDAPRELTEQGMSVRGRVGYGGGEFTVANGIVYFCANGRLYKQAISGGRPRPITPPFGGAASPAASPDGAWIAFVHNHEGVDGIALVDADGELFPRKLAYGTDFVMQPAWNHDGSLLAFVAWDHPQMPWDGTQLRLAHIERDHAGVPYAASIETLVGDERTAIFQPTFSPDGRFLAYVSDATGWTQLYIYDLQTGTHTQITDAAAEHGIPAWVQGMRVYGWTHDSRAIYSQRLDRGFASLWRIDVRTRRAKQVSVLDAYTDLQQIAVSPTREEIALLASSSNIPPRVISLSMEQDDLPTTLAPNPDAPPSISVIVDAVPQIRIRARTSSENIPAAQHAKAQAIEWTGHDGEPVHGLYYAPTSTRYEDQSLPPLMVYVHGGPTSQVRAGYDTLAQFFATRGYAVLEPNYRGSTGYGKAYMDKLRGTWGYYDVEDCASGAAALAERGLADPRRFVIIGGSAGGYTVLQSLVSKPGFYRAGICSYGISNQFALALDTHKFEARYNDILFGALPDAADLYRERSPLFHADKIVDPVIIFQGEDDQVVPKSQSDSIVEALRRRGVTHEYYVYPGEGHGFRKPETIEDYYRRILNFLQQYVVFA